jgi:hypothetical protein
VDAVGVIVVSSYGGMSEAEATANQRLFAQEILPVLKDVDTGADLGLSVSVGGTSVPGGGRGA